MIPTTPKPRRSRSKPATTDRDTSAAAGSLDEQQAPQATPDEIPSAISPEASTPAATSLSEHEVAPPAQVEEPALPSPAAKVTKAGKLQALLTTPEGATLAGLCDALGWQSHTVRAALTRLRQAGHSVERGRAGDGRTVYRIVPIGSGEAPDASSDADVTVELIFSSKRTAAPSLFAAQDGEGA